MLNIKKPLSTKDSLKLLDLLCNDDDFRTAFAASPAVAMQTISAEAAESCSTCALLLPLASKRQFQKSSQALLSHLQEHAAFYTPHCFVASEITTTLRLHATQNSPDGLSQGWCTPA